MIHWIQEHRALIYALTGTSLVMFVASLAVVPSLVVRIPADYFAHEKRPPGLWAGRHPILRVSLAIARNTLGCVLLAAGAAMLVLPGQGLLTLLIGILVMELPYKYRFEKWLFSHRRVRDGINWLRKRAGA